jgi:hypothetical protein
MCELNRGHSSAVAVYNPSLRVGTTPAVSVRDEDAREPCQSRVRRRHGVPTELKHNVRAQPWTQLSGLSRDEDAREIEPAPRQAQTWVQRSQLVTRMLANRASPVPEATWGSDRTQAQCASSTVDTAQRSQSDEDTREPRRKNTAPPPPPSAFVQNSATPPPPPCSSKQPEEILSVGVPGLVTPPVE